MAKIVFLDFDGVITTLDSDWTIDEDKCALVKEICDNTGAKIVISSSWRHNTLSETIEKENLQDWSLKNYCIGITKRCFLTGDSRFTEIPRRGIEIEQWLREYKANNLDTNIQYVILDDNTYDLLYIQKDNVVQTDSYNGISEENVEQAISILNKGD